MSLCSCIRQHKQLANPTRNTCVGRQQNVRILAFESSDVIKDAIWYQYFQYFVKDVAVIGVCSDRQKLYATIYCYFYSFNYWYLQEDTKIHLVGMQKMLHMSQDSVDIV